MSKLVKKSMVVAFSLVVILVLAACGNSNNDSSGSADNSSGAESSDEKVVIKVADWLSQEHEVSKRVVIPWIDRIEELSEGQVEIEYYPGGQMGEGDHLLEAVKNNVVDIAHVGAQYYSDILPLSSIPANPNLIADGISGTQAYNRLVQEDLYEVEWKPLGIKPVLAFITDPYQIVNSKQEVKVLEDLKGLKMRTAGVMQEELIRAGNGVPASMPGAQLLTAWERGTIDGTLLSLISWPSYQLELIAKYATVNLQLSAFAASYAVNEDVWNAWPEKVQNAVLQASEEIALIGPEDMAERNKELLEEYRNNSDVEFYEFSEEELVDWKEKTDHFNTEWAETLDKEGKPGTETLDKFREYNLEYAQ